MADFQTCISLLLISVTSSVLFCVFFIRYTRPKSNFPPPPSPVRLPIIGHLHLFAPSPHEALHKLSLKYGPVFRVFLGSVPCVVVSSPETVKEFLKTNEHAILGRPQNSAIAYLTYGSKDFAFGPYGSYWKFMKKIVIKQLLSSTTVELQYPVRQYEINHFIKSVYQYAKMGKAVDLQAQLMMLTNNVVSRTLMSERYSDVYGDAGEVRKLMTDITVFMGNFDLADYIWFFKVLDLQGFGKKLKDVHERFDALIEKIMKEHEDARKDGRGETTDILSILLDIAEDESMEIKLTRENIKAFILDIVIAGTDSAAATTEWALAELINRPHIMEKAKEEINRVVGKNRLLQESDIPNLPYLQAIVKESFRLHPPAPLIPRRSTEDCIVAGYHIAANTTIYVNTWALGRDPGSWENPLEFRPERFEESQVDVRGQHFQMTPFGSGRRMCPGISVALHLIHTSLGIMIQCFDWKAGKDGNLTSVDMKEGYGLTIRRANPLVCVPVARLDCVLSSIEQVT
uniref:cytochrome P450 93A2-like n=1 Tax=Erigeron canadensis TaxID=72917 RepID=UPI001CB994A6|nr:cytochrome P450 93A2-like [Erigeron canadensis]